METIDDKYKCAMAQREREYKLDRMQWESQYEIQNNSATNQWETGNIRCKLCGKMYSATHFKKCPHCCPHNELDITDQWTGSEPNGMGWIPDFVCVECGKNYDWSLRDLKSNYKIVRK